MSSSKELPARLKEIVMSRKDLIALKYENINNERLLVRWLLNHGQYEYSGLLEGDINDNEILKWRSSPTNDIYYSNLPKIILGIWDSFSSHRLKWPNPQQGRLYILWLRHKWIKINLKLPPYKCLFKVKDISQIYSNSIYYIIYLRLL